MTCNVLAFLENSAAKYPDKIAVKEEARAITYAQLLEQSRKIGSGLSQIITAGTPTGVYMEKGIDALCSFFGIVYAGSFYAMLNTELPAKRLQQMQSIMHARVILTTVDLEEEAARLFPDTVICTAEALKNCKIDEARLQNVRDHAIDTDPLYINFTSGSTGIPKGIVAAHRSVIDFIDFFTKLFSIEADDVIANQAPFDFDVSVKDIYSTIKAGATLVIVPREFFSAPARLLDYLCESRITTMIWAVSALCLITTFHGLDYKTPETVAKILFSGEVMPYKHLCEWQKHLPDALYVNLYGPTEITCNCTYHILEKGRDYSAGIPIGKHFPNEDVFLLGPDNERITRAGVIGKIFVRGTALALGYYNQPEKNAAQFIQNPLNTAFPELVYSTGDLGTYNEDSDLVFCGRSDNQVKYLGHRIELEEIERSMAAVEGVDRCFCVFDTEKSRLKGYYVGSIEKNELHAIMRENLPVFMVPGFIRRLDEIPLTKNGKIRKDGLI